MSTSVKEFSIKSHKQAFKELLYLSLPLIVGQLSQMLIAMGDLMVASRYSTEALAAVGLALALIHPLFIAGFGFLVALSPLLAQRLGQGNSIDSLAFSAVIVGAAASLIAGVMVYLSAFATPLFGYSPELTEMIVEYVKVSSLSVPGAYLFIAVKEYLQAEEKVFFANLVSFIFVPLNVVLNFLLVFGTSSIGGLGFIGVAWASVVVRTLMGASLIFYIRRDLCTSFKGDMDFIRMVAKLGLPLAGTFFIEVLAFSSVTLLVGYFGEVQTAASNLVLNLASTSFMVPLALGSAVSVKVGYAYGKSDIDELKTFVKVGLLTVVCYNAILTLAYLLTPRLLLGLYQPDEAVMIYGLQMILWVAVFQIFDGLQVMLSGILRGISISKITAQVMFFAYWIIGIPLGYLFAYTLGYQGQGFWMGMAVALFMVALSLGLYTHNKIMKLAQ